MPEPISSGGPVRQFRTYLTYEGDSAVVWASGELDLATRPSFVDAVLEQLPDRKGVVADLSQLIFVDSSGLSAMIECRNVAVASGRTFHVRGAVGPVQQVLTIAGLAGYLEDSQPL